MEFSCGNHSEIEFSLIDETSSTAITQQNMEVQEGGVDKNTDFRPVEHPMEPPDEDRPVKCPIPQSSLISTDKRRHEKRFSESLRKRGEIPGERTAAMDTEPPVQGVRKRHHTLTHGGDIVMTPLMRMAPLIPQPSQNITIFQVLQQLDKFES